MEQTFVALGSNIGDSQATVTQALARGPIRVSDLYRTEAIAATPQNDYLNAVCCFYTALSPYELLYELRSIERDLGQLVKSQAAPRILDLDILFYGDQIINEPPVLEIPHPRWKERLFVVAPLHDLLPTDEVAQLAVRLAHQRIARIDAS